MKALLILIVTVGTSQANVETTVNSSLDVRQIEFASLHACERAAARLTGAARSNSDWAKTFGTTSTSVNGRGLSNSQPLFVAPPTVIAECVEVE